MHSDTPLPTYEVSKFKHFRFNLIQFLRLPIDISEGDLRNAIRRCSANVFAEYMSRAQRAVAGAGSRERAPERMHG